MGTYDQVLRRQRDSRDAGFYYSRKFEWLNTCVYCGQIANCLDHVFPLSRAAKIDLSQPNIRKHLRGGLYLVSCCNSCNQIARDEPFDSILKKRAFIQKKLYDKHYKKMRTVIWDKEEIQYLGRNMKAEVLKMLHNRYILENRIFYPQIKTSISQDVLDMLRLYKKWA